MNSALYVGEAYHRRASPRRHAFRQRLFLAYLDLEELESVFAGRWLWSSQRPNLAWFRRADYLGPADRPLREAVLERVRAACGRRPQGAVRVLTHLRTWGYLFNPVSFYYCFDARDELDAVVAEIMNTPWRERHAYVLDARAARERADGAALRFRFAKEFHVSPFHPMEQTYEWTLEPPGERLRVHMQNREAGEPVFEAGLACRRRPIDGRNLAAALVAHPLLTLRIHAAIYWQAARLWSKRTPFHAHPSQRVDLRDATTP